MTLEEFRKKLGEDEAFRTEVEAKAKSFKEQNPDKSDPEIDQMLSAEYGVEKPSGKDISDDDMDAVAGGILGLCPDAADGHEIGCIGFWYFDEIDAFNHMQRCTRCGGPVEEGCCYKCRLNFNTWDYPFKF